eukprot:12282659-Prorocentrum_lima.AAC.1
MDSYPHQAALKQPYPQARTFLRPQQLNAPLPQEAAEPDRHKQHQDPKSKGTKDQVDKITMPSCQSAARKAQ